MLIYVIIAAAALILTGVDQLTKAIVVKNMSLGSTVPAIKGLLNWHYLENDGASFSILEGARWFFVVGTAVVIGVVIYFIAKKYFCHWLGYASATLIIAGGLGNLIDRIRIGRVIDFIDISPLFRFPVFNFADCCIVVGGIALCVYILFVHDKFAPKKADEEEKDA